MKKKYLLLMALLALLVPTTSSAYSFKDGDLYYNITSDSTIEVTCIRATYPSPYSGDIVVPETVTYQDTTYTVTAIGEFAFYGSYGLTSIVIPNTVTVIGTSSFVRCRNLTSIDIPNSVTRIRSTSFAECTGLKSLYIPASVISIEGNPFHDCSGLESIVVDEGNTVYDSRENCNAIVQTATNRMLIGCQNTFVPASVTSFGAWVFAGVTGFTSFEIPYGITSIPNYMLAWCTNLTSVEIPNTVTSIGYDAFRNCSSLSHVEIPNSVRSIDMGAFSEMSSLESLHIPSSVTSIYESFLNGSGATTSLTVDSNNQYYDSRDNCNAIIHTASNKLLAGCQNTVIPPTVTSIAYCAFTRCVMKSIDIPNNVTSIDEFAFGFCPNLTRVTLPDSITIIEDGTFYECQNLKAITIPAPVTVVADNAFRRCYSLKKVVSKPIVPPSLTQYTFAESYGATLFVPNESVGDYRAHQYWGKFSHIVPFIGAGPGDVDGDGSININDVTSLIDQILAGEAPAYCDVDGDGVVDISDLTQLIDMMLRAN